MEIFCAANLLNGAILFVLLSVCLILALPGKYRYLPVLLSVLTTSVATGWLSVYALLWQPVELTLQFGSFAGNVLLQIDGLSAWFILIVNFTVLTGFFYGMGYLKSYKVSGSRLSFHWILFLIFHVSMLFVCMLQNGFAFLVVWEIMSLSSMLLVFFDHENPKTFKAALNYFVQMHVSVTFLTIGFIWVYHLTGSFSFEAIQTVFRSSIQAWKRHL